MCGIFGVIDRNIQNKKTLLQCLDTLEHRGPDQSNYISNKNYFVGHRRLSILDLSEKGKQPMISNEVILTVNGEIYNYQTLKKNLSIDYEFNSNSDSEVILAYYLNYGIEKLLADLDGMFSIFLMDNRTNKSYLIRDRVGIKPAYFSFSKGNRFCWGSEIKCIKSYIKDTDYDETALYDFLTYLYIPHPKTAFKEIRKLGPGEFLTLDNSSLEMTIKEYWTPSPGSLNSDKVKIFDEVRNLITSSCRDQMIADVPLGFFLSGGVDSNILVKTGSEISTKPINTFTVKFNQDTYDESNIARTSAIAIKSLHHEQNAEEIDVEMSNKQLLKWFDEPFADTSAFPTYQVSAAAKKKVTVILSGDGGDELFFGYNWYSSFFKFQRKKNKYPRIGLLKVIDGYSKNKFLKILLSKIDFLFLDDLEKYTRLMGGMIAEEKLSYKKLLNIPKDYDDYWFFRKNYDDNLDEIKRLQLLDFKTYLPCDILTKVDITSMQSSLECRVPFLSNQLVEFAFNLSSERLYENQNLKAILKGAYRNSIDSKILKGKKKGFSIPWRELSGNGDYFKQEAILKDFLNA